MGLSGPGKTTKKPQGLNVLKYGTADKIHKAAISMGIPNEKLPEPFRNRVIARSRKGVLGRLSVLKFGGTVNNDTYKLLRDFEKRFSKEEILATLSLTDDPRVRVLVDLSKEGPSTKSLARLIAEAKLDVARVFTAFAKGKAILHQVQALAEAAEGMPRVVRELLRLGIPKGVVCTACFGSKRVPRTPAASVANTPCPVCKGEGELLESHDSQMDAIKMLSELAGMKGPPGGLHVTTQVGVKVEAPSSTGGFLELVHQQREALLGGPPQASLPPAPEDIVEAQVVGS